VNFLAPLFALGALAVIGPILFHLIRRTTREVTPFSTLMFLQPTPPRVTKRSRLENLWLLLARCLVIALLALAFARPFLPRTTPAPSPGSGQRTVILVDTSASMRRDKLWADALSHLDTRLRAVQPGDEMAVLAFDGQTHSVLSFEEWRKLPLEERATTASQRLAALGPGWGSTHLDDALLHAVEALDQAGETQPGRREIVVVSDLQEGARLDGLQGFQWPVGLTVTLDPVKAPARPNANFAWISESEENDKPGDETPLRLRVTNAADAKREQFQIRWKTDATPPAAAQEAYVPAGQSRIVRAPKPPAGATALALAGDETDFDNTLYVVPPQAAQLPILYVGREPADSPQGALYYLLRAFPKTARQNVQITAHGTPEAVPGFQLQQAQLLVMSEGADAAALASVRQFAREGKIVIFPMVTTVGAQKLADLLEIERVPVDEATTKDYALLAQIEFAHPLFAPFADPRFSDFTKIHWWHHRKLDLAPLPAARVLARFDDGDPAIVQVPLGKGSVVIFTSSWSPRDSQLALSSKFVPMLHALLDQSSNLPPQKAQYFIGEEVPLPGGPQPLIVRKPDGTEVAATPGTKFSVTDQPGVYQVTPGTLRFIVNLSPEESRLVPLPEDRFTSLGVPLRTGRETPAEIAKREGQAQATEIENQQKLWRWLLVAALGLLLLETFFAGKLSRTSGSSTTAPI
jgi:hypothetical protein